MWVCSQLLEAQADYHRKALAVLEKALPEMQAHQDRWAEKPAFGTPLEEHLKRSGREIALPLEACVMLLLETGMREEVRPRRLPLRRSPWGVPATPGRSAPGLPFARGLLGWGWGLFITSILIPRDLGSPV